MGVAAPEGQGVYAGLREVPQRLDYASDAACPASLVTSSNAGPIVAVEVFIEQNQVLPVGVVLKLFGTAVNGSPPRFILQENAHQPLTNAVGNFIQGDMLARACGVFHRKGVAVVAIELQQGPQQQQVHWHPNGTPPVGVAAEHA